MSSSITSWAGNLLAPWTMRLCGGIPPSGKEKEEELEDLGAELTSIDSLPIEILTEIFRLVTNNGKDVKTLCCIRAVNRQWYYASDLDLELHWKILRTQIQHPHLQSTIDACDRRNVFNTAHSLHPRYFPKFHHLTYTLTGTSRLLGFEPQLYLDLQQRLDAFLEAIRSRNGGGILGIYYEESSLPIHAQSIRQWLSNPANAEQIAYINVLNLNKTHLTLLSPEISKFSHLTNLYLEENQIPSLPYTIGNLSHLTWLSLSENQLSTLPRAIGKLSQLKHLNLDHNQLSSLPCTIGNLSRLTYLSLSYNQISTLPRTIGKLSQLKSLILDANQLSSLPRTFSKLSRLKMLSLSNNQFKSLPEIFDKLARLEYLALSNNQLSFLPRTLINLSWETRITLESNPLICLLNQNLFVCQKIENPKNIMELNKKHAACTFYQCLSDLAWLCQKIHDGSDSDVLQNAFEALSDEMQEQIRQAWEAIPSSSSGPSEPESDLFADRSGFAQAVIVAMQKKRNTLSWDQLHQIDQFIDEDRQKRLIHPSPFRFPLICNRKSYSEENIIRLIDAMEFVTQQPATVHFCPIL